jgi:hypothetical protein
MFDYSRRDEYNYKVNKFNYQNMLFLRHHYNCSRNDSLFWVTYRDKKLHEILDKIYTTFNNPKPISDVFKIDNGTLTFTKEQYKHIFNNNFLKKEKTLI